MILCADGNAGIGQWIGGSVTCWFGANIATYHNNRINEIGGEE